MTVPAQITAGSTVQWIEPAATDPAGDPATSATWTLQITFRTNTAGEGATVNGSARSDGGWDVALSAATTTHRLLLHVVLLQAHGAPVLDIDRGDNQHVSFRL